MTKQEFEALCDASVAAPLPIMLASGKFGLCSHWNDHEIIVDAYDGNVCTEVHVLFTSVHNFSGGALIEVPADGASSK